MQGRMTATNLFSERRYDREFGDFLQVRCEFFTVSLLWPRLRLCVLTDFLYTLQICIYIVCMYGIPCGCHGCGCH